MFSKGISKFKSDAGNATAVLGLLLIITTLFVGGLMLDFTKNYQMRDSYILASKKATQAGIMEQNTQGFLTPMAAARAVHTYENITRRSVISPGSPLSSCNNNRNVEIRVIFRDEDFIGAPTGASESDPVLTIMSNQVQGSPEATLARMSGPIGAIENGEYIGIQMQIVETTKNYVLPGVFRLTRGGDEADSMMCQNIGVNSGASIFSGETDVFY